MKKQRTGSLQTAIKREISKYDDYLESKEELLIEINKILLLLYGDREGYLYDPDLDQTIKLDQKLDSVIYRLDSIQNSIDAISSSTREDESYDGAYYG